MKPLIIHHTDPDGYGSALAAYEKFGDDAEYVAMNYDDDPLALDYEGRDVYWIDVTWPDCLLEYLLANTLTIIDHHKSFKKVYDKVQHRFVEGHVNYIYDPDKAACVLAWEYFHPAEFHPDPLLLAADAPAIMEEKPVPELLLYIQDRDLWKFELPNSKEINAWLGIKEMSIESYHDILHNIPQPDWQGQVSTIGRAIIKYQHRLIESHLERVYWAEFEGHLVPHVNCSNPELVSELGNRMAELEVDELCLSCGGAKYFESGDACDMCQGEGVWKNNAPFAVCYRDEQEEYEEFLVRCPECKKEIYCVEKELDKNRRCTTCYNNKSKLVVMQPKRAMATRIRRHYSLRSAPGGMDVSEIAKKKGGGGHKHSAGCSEVIS